MNFSLKRCNEIFKCPALCRVDHLSKASCASRDYPSVNESIGKLSFMISFMREAFIVMDNSGYPEMLQQQQTRDQVEQNRHFLVLGKEKMRPLPQRATVQDTWKRIQRRYWDSARNLAKISIAAANAATALADLTRTLEYTADGRYRAKLLCASTCEMSGWKWLSWSRYLNPILQKKTYFNSQSRLLQEEQ